MLKLIYGKPSSGLAEALIHRAKDEGGSQIFLVPRHFSHEYERTLCRVYGDSASLFAEVLTMSRLARRVLSELGGLGDEYLTDAGRLLLLRLAARRVETRLGTLAPYTRRPEFLLKVVEVIDELKACRVDITTFTNAAAMMDGAAAGRMNDLALLYAAYDAELGRVADPRDVYSRLAEALAGGWAKGMRVKVYGFTEFNAQELEILRVLMQTCDELCVAFEHDPTQTADADSPFYAQARSAKVLKTLAKEQRCAISEEILPSATDGRIDDLLRLEEVLTRRTPLQQEMNCKVVRLYAELDVRSEVERAAAHILRLVRGGAMYRDIAVAVPEEGDYRGVIQAVFEGWGIPVFYDTTEPIAHKPVVTAVLSAVDIIIRGFDAADVSRFLKTGLAPIGFASSCRLENYIYTWDIGRRHWQSGADWRMNPFGFSAPEDERSERELEYINASRRSVAKQFTDFMEAVHRGREYPANVLIREFYEFLEALRLDTAIARREAELRALGDLRTASEYSQLWGIICSILDTAFDILGDTPLTFDELAAMFKLLVESAEVGAIPAALDGVPVGSAGRLRHRDVKYLFILGAIAGEFPPSVRDSGLLTIAEREALCELGLPVQPPVERLGYRSIDAAYAALTLPKQGLFVSWTTADGGSPSYIIEQIARAFGLTPQPPSTRERLLYAPAPALHIALEAAGGMGGDAYSRAALRYVETRPEYAARLDIARRAALADRGALSADGVALLYGAKPVLTASRIEQYKACAFGYFMRYGLNAKARKRATLDRPEAGSVVHAVLERTVRDIYDEGLLDGDIDERVSKRAHQLAEGYLAEYAVQRSAGLETGGARAIHAVDALRSVVSRSIDCVIDEMALSEFRPKSFELRFGGDGELPSVDVGGVAELRGAVDRVDGWTSPDGQLFLRVLDYKSGRRKFSYADVYHGSHIQLFIYLFALQKHGSTLYGLPASGAGVLYSPVRDETASLERGASDAEIQIKISDAERRSGLLLGNRMVVDAMEWGDEKRFLPIKYKKDGGFNMQSSYVATPEQFELIERHTERVLKHMANDLLSGCVEATPSLSGSRLHCDICDFRAACHYDESNGRDHSRYYFSVGAKDLWQKLGGEQGGV